MTPFIIFIRLIRKDTFGFQYTLEVSVIRFMGVGGGRILVSGCVHVQTVFFE